MSSLNLLSRREHFFFSTYASDIQDVSLITLVLRVPVVEEVPEVQQENLEQRSGFISPDST